MAVWRKEATPFLEAAGRACGPRHSKKTLSNQLGGNPTGLVVLVLLENQQASPKPNAFDGVQDRWVVNRPNSRNCDEFGLVCLLSELSGQSWPTLLQMFTW